MPEVLALIVLFVSNLKLCLYNSLSSIMAFTPTIAFLVIPGNRKFCTLKLDLNPSNPMLLSLEAVSYVIARCDQEL